MGPACVGGRRASVVEAAVVPYYLRVLRDSGCRWVCMLVIAVVDDAVVEEERAKVDELNGRGRRWLSPLCLRHPCENPARAHGPRPSKFSDFRAAYAY